MSSPAYDSSLYSHSMLDGDQFEPEFVDRQTVEVGDSNGQSYGSGNVVFDLQSLSTGSSFLDVRGAQIVIPIQIATQATTGAFTASRENAFCACLKTSVYSLIDSIVLNINGTEIVSAQQRLNMYANYKLLSEWSVNDADQAGPQILFAKDTVESLTNSTVLGEINNELKASPAYATNSTSVVTGGQAIQNQGRFKRARWMTLTNEQVYEAFNSQANAATQWSNTCDTTSTSTITHQCFLSLPVRGLHDIFERLPLLRNCLIKLTLQTHCPASYSVTTDANGVYSAPVSNCPREFMPISLTTGGAVGTGLVLGTATGISTSISIGNNTSKQCLFRVNRYTMSPDSETKYLAQPVRRIEYDDYFSYVQRNVNASVNALQVGSSLSRVRRLLVIPQVSASANGSAGIAPLASALSSAGGTCAPFWKCNQFQVNVNGRGIYSQPLSYSFAQWATEFDNSQGLAGGFNNSLRSGLISEYDYRTLYGFMDVNLARHSAIDDDSPSIVSLSLTPLYRKSVDLFMFLVYGRSFSINVSTGEMTA